MTDCRFFHAVKAFIDLWDLFRFDAISGIFDGKTYAQITTVCRLYRLHIKGHAALGGVLDRIGQKVDQNLTDTDIIPDIGTRQGRIDNDLKNQIFLLGMRRQHLIKIGYHIAQIIMYRQDIEFAGR